MKIRKALQWLNDALRPPHVKGEGHEPAVDKTTALTTMRNPAGPLPHRDRPVPSQQDDGPHS